MSVRSHVAGLPGLIDEAIANIDDLRAELLRAGRFDLTSNESRWISRGISGLLTAQDKLRASAQNVRRVGGVG